MSYVSMGAFGTRRGTGSRRRWGASTARGASARKRHWGAGSRRGWAGMRRRARARAAKERRRWGALASCGPMPSHSDPGWRYICQDGMWRRVRAGPQITHPPPAPPVPPVAPEVEAEVKADQAERERVARNGNGKPANGKKRKSSAPIWAGGTGGRARVNGKPPPKPPPVREDLSPLTPPPATDDGPPWLLIGGAAAAVGLLFWATRR